MRYSVYATIYQGASESTCAFVSNRVCVCVYVFLHLLVCFIPRCITIIQRPIFFSPPPPSHADLEAAVVTVTSCGFNERLSDTSTPNHSSKLNYRGTKCRTTVFLEDSCSSHPLRSVISQKAGISPHVCHNS